jgi:Effector Associated Constant Component 1
MGAMPAERLEVGIDAGPDVNDEELRRLSRRLRAELLEVGVERVDYGTGLVPSGAKSGTAVSLGTIVVTLSDSAVLAALVGVLRTWARRGSDRKVTIQLGKDKLEIKGTLDEREAGLIARWLDQHAGK